MELSEKKPDASLATLYLYGFALYLFFIVTVSYLNFWEHNTLYAVKYGLGCEVSAENPYQNL